jgi:glycosyltransferase involved in cell wall biosynthesis
MKVMLVANVYPPVIGGTERHVQNLARELVSRGHDVAVATICPAGADPFEVDEFGVRIYRIKRGWFRWLRPHEPVHLPLANRGVAAALRTIMTAERPDVVYAHNWILYSYLAAVRRRTQVPVLACLHDYWPLCPDRSLYSGGRTCRHDTLLSTVRCGVRAHQANGVALGIWLWNSRRRWHHRVDRYLAVSQYVADACRPALADRPVFVAHSFVSSDLVNVADNAPIPDFLPKRPYLLYVGRLGAHKGVTVLADAYRQLGPSAPPLLVIGAPEPGFDMRWPANVQVVRSVPHDQVMVAWRHALVGVIPSIWPEPFGQVAVEVMATGTPVVASNVGGLAEVLDKYPGGILVPPGSETALAAALKEAILNSSDLRRQARETGPAAASEFFVSNVTDIVEQHLFEVIEERRVQK